MKIKVAIIGLGIGIEHIQNYLKLPDLFEVKALCDLDKILLSQVAAQYKINGQYNQVDELLQNEDIDLVDICLPPSLHFELTRKILLHSKHVVCEKPLFKTIEEFTEIEKLVSKKRRVFSVFQYRYGLGFQQLKALVENKVAGSSFLTTASTEWYRKKSYFGKKWRASSASALGGCIISHAIHTNDIIMQINGVPKFIFAYNSSVIHSLPIEDTAVITFKFDNGALGSHAITLGSVKEISRLRFSFENLCAESGTAPYAPGNLNWRLDFRNENIKKKALELLSDVKCKLTGYAGMFSDIYHDIKQMQYKAPTIQDAKISILLSNAAYSSIKHKKEIPLFSNIKQNFV